MKTISKLALVAALGGFAVSAQADPFEITQGFGTTTSSINALGSTNLFVTSVYTETGATVNPTSADDLIGVALTVTDSGSGSIDTLSPLAGFIDTAGFGDLYKMNFTYNISAPALFVDDGNGTLDLNNDGLIDLGDFIVPDYSMGSGSFQIFYEQANDANPLTPFVGLPPVQVANLTLTSGMVSGANVIFEAAADYGFAGAGAAFVQDFFRFTGGPGAGQTFADLVAGMVTVTMRTDLNVDPDFVPLCDNVGCTSLSRTTDTNTSTIFSAGDPVNVPEPATVGLLGLALVGLGVRRRTARK